ncbi:hypothetical protein L6164_015945 [Bauhinia variegata]|uniref:Uncharacterized protein n=1 Tax=Bauhinia variegata TaxID=167791 RepID=A0ACB9NM39_BAUVA|nr:hypothetical protein L6164_015945 [Bauhinia variegata]
MAESAAPRMNQKMKEPITVRVPQSSSPPSSLKINHKVSCNNASVCSSAHLIMQNHTNFKASAAPARCMFYHGGSWVDFQSDVVESWRSAFREEKPVIELIIGGAKYLLDFLRMVQIDLGSGYQRSIAWIDENDKCFFPKAFIGEDFTEGFENSINPKIEIDIRIDGLNDDGERKRAASDMDDGKHKKHKDEEASSKRRSLTNAKLLGKEDRPYILVSNLFLSEMRKVDVGVTITAIHQWECKGPIEKARHEDFQRQIEITKAARGASNTVFAWYAAPANRVSDILTYGFGFPSNTLGSPAYGVGIYLSPVSLPHLSVAQLEEDKNGEKHIILCQVILGKVEKVEKGSRQRGPSGADFDTGADDPKNPKWYVVWSTNMNTRIIPESVVSFKSGQLGPPTKQSFDKLLRR